MQPDSFNVQDVIQSLEKFTENVDSLLLLQLKTISPNMSEYSVDFIHSNTYKLFSLKRNGSVKTHFLVHFFATVPGIKMPLNTNLL